MDRSLRWLLLTAAILYLFFPAAVLECDAVIYSCAGLARDLVQSTDAGHLAWGFFEMGAAALGSVFSPPVHPVDLLRWLAVGSAWVGLWFFAGLGRRLGASGAAAFVTTGLLGFSYSYWHFGVQAESHLVATLFLILFAASTREALRAGNLRATAWASAFLSLSTLFHQTGILLVPVFLVPAWFAVSGARERVRLFSVFLGIYFLGVIVPYLGVGWWVRDFRSYGEFRDWILGLSLWGLWGEWENTTGPAALIGAGRSLVGSHYLLGINWVERLAFRVVPNASWADETALAVTVPGGVCYLLLFLQTLWFSVLLVGLVRVAGGVRDAWREHGRMFGFLGLWLAIYTPFILWWAPVRAEFWIAVFLPALLLVAPALLRGGWPTGWRRGVPVVFVAALAVLNLVGSLAPQSRRDVEPELQALVALNAVARTGDFVLSDTALRGRATRYVYTLDKVNLLHPSPWRTSRMSPAAEGAPLPGTYEEADRLPIPELTDPVERALATVSVVLRVARNEKRNVYLAMQPLAFGENRRAEYLDLLPRIEERFELSEEVPVRSGVVWRKVLRPIR